MENNPFQKIHEEILASDMKTKLANPLPFPRMIDIELTNSCNFRCTMCPTGQRALRRDTGFMSQETFQDIFKQIEQHKTPVRFIRWGEPTLHSNFIEWVRLLESKGVPCHLNTNGSRMTSRMFDDLLEIPITSIKFSLQGVTRKQYYDVRGKDFFVELGGIIQSFAIKKRRREKPYIHVGTTVGLLTTEGEKKRFRMRMRRYADLVTIGETKILSERNEKGYHCQCPEVFDKLSIDFDGKVVACCGDYDRRMVVGDLAKETLAEIWWGKRLAKIRIKLASFRHSELYLCSRCARPNNEIR